MEDSSSTPLEFEATKSLLEKVFQENCSADDAEIVSKASSLNSLGGTGELIMVTKTSKIVTADKNSSCTTLYTLSAAGELRNTGVVVPVDPNTVASKSSPCGRHKAVIKANGDNNFVVELYTESLLVWRKEVKDKWKAVATSGYIVSAPIVWSSDSARFLFVVEPHFAPKVSTPKTPFEEAFLGNHKYRHNFGEAHFQFYEVQPVVFDLSSRTLRRVVGLPKQVIPTHALFASEDGRHLAFTGLDSSKFVPGLAFANNKNSRVFRYADFQTHELFSEEPAPAELSPSSEGLSRPPSNPSD